MHGLSLRLAILHILVGFLVSACSNAQAKTPLVHIVDREQAVIVQDVTSSSDGADRNPVPSDLVPEELAPTEIAAEPTKPLSTYRDQCDEIEGRIERSSYPGRLSGEPVPIMVYLPPCYDPSLQIYPVIFLLHGKPQNERHWLLLGVDDVATRGILDGDWPPFVMVMPYQPEPLFSNSDGGPGSLEQEIMQGLVPFILDQYAITGDGARWAIAGISRGGIWALELSFQYPAQFQNIAALSPALSLNYARPAYDPMLMVTEPREFPDRIFLGVGDVDWARAKTSELASILDELNLVHLYLEFPGNHDSYTWVALIPEMLSYLTAAW
jgi:enterochelin esterase-like enzyme